MKHTLNCFSIILLLSPVFFSCAMEKEQPPTSFSFKQLLNPVIKPITDYQQATKDKEQATQALFGAIKNNDLDKVKTALAQKADLRATQPLSESNKTPITPLHRAMQTNNSQIVEALVYAGADPFAHQSLLLVDEHDVFPLSLLPLANTLTEKYHRFMILQSCAITIIKNSTLSEIGYHNYITHLKKLFKKYDALTFEQKTEKLHSEDQVKIIKYLNAWLQSLDKNKDHVPEKKTIFNFAIAKYDSQWVQNIELKNGLVIPYVQTSTEGKELIELNQNNPAHPLLQLYDALCCNRKSTQKDITDTINQYKTLNEPTTIQGQNSNEFNQTKK